MISEEKLMMRLLRDYFICKLYTQASISSRNISSLTGVSIASVKRAIHILDEKKDECLRLLPIALKKAFSDGILSAQEKLEELNYINEEHLTLLKTEIELTVMELQIETKWSSSSHESGSTLIKIIEKINSKYFSQKRDLSLTKSQVKNLINIGNSFQKVADTLGISKATAYRYYKRDISSDEVDFEQSNITRKR